MKLLRLKITDDNGFRSLQAGFEINFLRKRNNDEAGEFNPYILAGPNGSGKSNVLEVLAAIFYHLECIYHKNMPKSFAYDETENPHGFRGEEGIPNGFEMEYYIPAPPRLNKLESKEYADIMVVKEKDKAPMIYWINRDLFEIEITKQLLGNDAKEVLPDFILAYSSGENEILSLPFFKMRFIHYDAYMDSIMSQISYTNISESRLTFLSNEFSQAILLSNLLLQEKDLLTPFRTKVGVEEISIIRIIIKKYVKIDINEIDNLLDTENSKYRIFEIIEDEFGKKVCRLDITQNLKEPVIDKLIACSTCSYYDAEGDMLYLDYWVNEETKQAFAFYFYSPIELFQVFQLLLTLNLYTVSEKLKKDLYQSSSLYVNETIPSLPSDERIMRFKDIWIQKVGLTDNILYKSLSDGEHQLLHSLGLCLLYKHKNCLFLLDEPETHFNPSWRANFVSNIRDCFKDKESNITLHEMLITTHTPFLISDSKKEYVLVFSKSDDNKVNVTRPDYNTLGASVNKITMKTFGKLETIGGYAEQQLNKINERFKVGAPKQALIDEVNNLLGDSIEKVLFVKKVRDSMEEE